MCGCLVLLLGALFPRFALVLIEMFSDWNDQAFDSFWIGFAGITDQQKLSTRELTE